MFSKIHTCSVYFTDELSRQILEAFPLRSLFLGKIDIFGEATALPIQIN